MVMLNFHKISLRPPWSIFIISQTPKIIFKSNQSHWKAKTIIYNFHVYTKGQFKTETCEKDARTRNRGCCQSAARGARRYRIQTAANPKEPWWRTKSRRKVQNV
ncbi:hypothetical protein MTR_7g083575 [Medicago truncatula]|uniref:Uncharacterized protein n=1 Tax=Medicago truncatula TaxID=3880 RepID=A0A072U245_MEDTR|nr:hypothetical protein MTR_7g083575 [Medicago truncatula]